MYIFIAYKPNSDLYSMGCHVASHTSDFKHQTIESKDQLIGVWSNILLENMKCEAGEAGYEVAVYEVRVCGLGFNVTEGLVYGDKEEIELLANVRADNLYKAYQEYQRLSKEQEQQNELRRKEKYEREQYEKLHAKFGSA